MIQATARERLVKRKGKANRRDQVTRTAALSVRSATRIQTEMH
ncbi:hypothetical protein [Paraburkholderia phytofirmans]|jgi:hypothetical protein|nr:hypothetical protein [Paraburkholderia phytofirmans]